ncbi:MAG: hypothetical protein OSJ58_06670 [Dysosmobacter sp.]|nr:hypothetical protein [Dysosmobacter sp.]
MKRIISLFLSVLLICTISLPVLAVDESNRSEITQFSYVVFDKNKNVVSSGITPNFNSRYSWDGITLENGEYVYFQKTDGTNFVCFKNTRVTFSITKDRRDDLLCQFLETTGSSNLTGYYLHTVTFPGLTGATYFSTGTPFYGADTGFYVMKATNLSSDPITITSATITF